MDEMLVRTMADAVWKYILQRYLKEYLSDSVCYYMASVTTAPSGGRIGVTRPFDNEIFVKCASNASGLTVGAKCMVLVFGDPSNALAIGDVTAL